jgi:serine/threonine protein kinase
MALASGTSLGPYKIQSLLGAEGMGEVYRARDTRLDRTVAIKILAAHLSSSPELKQRFEREARTVSSLNHNHICHLYDVGSQNGTDYLVMEFLEGHTLAERLRKRRVTARGKRRREREGRCAPFVPNAYALGQCLSRLRRLSRFLGRKIFPCSMERRRHGRGLLSFIDSRKSGHRTVTYKT